MHRLPNQFVCWKLRQKPGKPKPDKIPIDRLGREIDCHDQANWLTYEDAKASGLNIGFVVTAADPYFFYDLDGCREGANWNARTVEICSMFQGAAMEISQSGDGIHIVGRCDPMVGISRRNRLEHHSEFYFAKRFIAFGPTGWQGDFDMDFTQLILKQIPVRLPSDDVELTSEVDPTYTGPADDEELLGMMLASRGGLGQQFGEKATIRELWDADSVKLAQVFPSITGDIFDRSAADAALMSHLAFWTGRDLSRMDRLFKRSGLMREKYEKRPEYREWTVTNAAKGCRNVFNVPRMDRRFEVAPEVFGEEERVTTDEGVAVYDLKAGMPISNHGTLTPTDQMDYFKNMVYIMEDHCIWVQHNNSFMPPERFSAFYGGATFIIESEGKKPTKSPFEAFTQNACVRFPRVMKGIFRPDRRSMERYGETSINTYIAHEPMSEEGDVSLFLTHLQKLFVTERDMYQVLYWFASVARYPDKRIHWAPVIQGVEGNGKSFLGDVLTYIVGENYTHKPNAEDISNKFNDYIDRKLLIIVEEAHMQGRREMMDVLKPLITNSRVEIQPKGGKKRMIENWAKWIFFTNHKDAFPVDLKNRRYSVYYTRQQSKEQLVADGMDSVYFIRLWNWFYNGGAKALCHYLKTVDIPVEYDPIRTLINAPVTSSTSEAIMESMGSAEQIIMEAIEAEKPGFKNGWISGWALNNLLKNELGKVTFGPNKKASILRGLKFEKAGRAGRGVFAEANERPTLYVREGVKPGEDYTTNYMTAQGYEAVPIVPKGANVVQLKK